MILGWPIAQRRNVTRAMSPLPYVHPYLTNWTASSALTGGPCGRQLMDAAVVFWIYARVLGNATAHNFGQAKRFEQLRPGETVQRQTPSNSL
jgi:hypothetical protein